MDLMDVLSLVPDAVRLVDEDKILILRIDHLADIVPVHVLEEDENLHDIDCMRGSREGTLGTILHVHVLVIITISHCFEAPATTVLELLRDLPPVPVLSNPREGRCTISGVDLEEVESGSETKSAHGQGLPEADPFDNTAVLIDDLTLSEVECGIRVHGGSLDEWLELIAGMSRCSFDSDNTLDRLLSKDLVTETSSNVRELLVITPFNLPLVTLIVIVMCGSGSGIKSLLLVDLLSLGEPGAGGLSPSMIELKVDVLETGADHVRLGMSDLVELGRDVALLFEVLRADLGDVHINEVGVVTVDLHHLVLVVTIDINVMVGADVLVGENVLRLAVDVSWSSHVTDLQVALLLLLIDLEEEVFLGNDLIVGALSELLAGDLVLELNKANLLLDDTVDSLANVSKVLGAASLFERFVHSWDGGVGFKGVQIGGLGLVLLSCPGNVVIGVIPECLDT